MNRILSCLTVLQIFIFSSISFAETTPATLPSELTVIGYHEIISSSQALIPEYAVSPEQFSNQIAWLKNHNYRFVNVDEVLKARREGKKLPQKSVLITFDDGYRSVYDNAFPILKAYQVPAVIALVGSWLVPEENQNVDFDHKSIPRNLFFSWDQLHEMVNSGLIEIGSHTFGLHDGIPANPQGNMEPAVTTRIFDSKTQSYENDDHYKNRIYNDLEKNNELLRFHGFKSPRVMVWPYGSYNHEVEAIALKLGMPISLTLEDGPNTNAVSLKALRRILVDHSLMPAELEKEINNREKDVTDNDISKKILYVNLDYIYDKNPEQQEVNLGKLLDRIVSLNVNSVFIQAFSATDPDGLADMLYFPNRHLPMRADLFNRVAWQIHSRTQVKRIFASMPLFEWNLSKISASSGNSRQDIKDMYADLAKSVAFDGLFFHDKTIFAHDLNVSTEKLRKLFAIGLSPNQALSFNDRELLLMERNKLQMQTNRFAEELISIVRFQQPYLLTARELDMQSNPILLWDSINHFDFTLLAANANEYLGQDIPLSDLDILGQIEKHHELARKSVFEIADNSPSKEVGDIVSKLYADRASHIMYYPENPLKTDMDIVNLRKAFDAKFNTPPSTNANAVSR